MYFFFFKQKTAYEMRISDWSSDVCSSDLIAIDQAERTVSAWSATRDTRPSQWAELITQLYANLQKLYAEWEKTTDLDGDALIRAIRRACSLRSEERRVGKECVRTCRSRG